MTVETVTYIGDLVPANPGATDPKSEGDDHIRNIKTALQDSIVGQTGLVLAFAALGGGSTAYTITLSPVPASYAKLTGALFLVSVATPNTGAVTINVNGLGAKSCVRQSNAALSANDLIAGPLYLLAFDGTKFTLLGVGA